jgi:hypothetical protein
VTFTFRLPLTPAARTVTVTFPVLPVVSVYEPLVGLPNDRADESDDQMKAGGGWTGLPFRSSASAVKGVDGVRFPDAGATKFAG